MAIGSGFLQFAGMRQSDIDGLTGLGGQVGGYPTKVGTPVPSQAPASTLTPAMAPPQQPQAAPPQAASSPSGGSNPQDYWLQGMISRGIDPVFAQGMIPNIGDESGWNVGIQETAPLAGRGGRGAYQLTGPRREEFERRYGPEGYNNDNQLDFLAYEINGPEKANYERIVKEAGGDPKKAAAGIVQHFLRPAAEHVKSRTSKYLGSTDEPWTAPRNIDEVERQFGDDEMSPEQRRRQRQGMTLMALGVGLSQLSRGQPIDLSSVLQMHQDRQENARQRMMDIYGERQREEERSEDIITEDRRIDESRDYDQQVRLQERGWSLEDQDRQRGWTLEDARRNRDYDVFDRLQDRGWTLEDFEKNKTWTIEQAFLNDEFAQKAEGRANTEEERRAMRDRGFTVADQDKYRGWTIEDAMRERDQTIMDRLQDRGWTLEDLEKNKAWTIEKAFFDESMTIRAEERAAEASAARSQQISESLKGTPYESYIPQLAAMDEDQAQQTMQDLLGTDFKFRQENAAQAVEGGRQRQAILAAYPDNPAAERAGRLAESGLTGAAETLLEGEEVKVSEEAERVRMQETYDSTARIYEDAGVPEAAALARAGNFEQADKVFLEATDNPEIADIAKFEYFKGLNPEDQALWLKQNVAGAGGVDLGTKALLDVESNRLGKEGEAVNLIREQRRRLQAAVQVLNDPNFVGGASSAYTLPLRKLADSIGIRYDPNVSKQEQFNAIAKGLISFMRQPGEGATSDFDADRFENSTINLKNTEDANRALAYTYDRILAAREARFEAESQYMYDNANEYSMAEREAYVQSELKAKGLDGDAVMSVGDGGIADLIESGLEPNQPFYDKDGTMRFYSVRPDGGVEIR